MEWLAKEVTRQVVVLESDEAERDAQGNLLRYVWKEGRMVNTTMVQLGLLIASPSAGDLRYGADLLAAQADAQSARRGMWGPPPGAAAAARGDHGDRRCNRDSDGYTHRRRQCRRSRIGKWMTAPVSRPPTNYRAQPARHRSPVGDCGRAISAAGRLWLDYHHLPAGSGDRRLWLPVVWRRYPRLLVDSADRDRVGGLKIE